MKLSNPVDQMLDRPTRSLVVDHFLVEPDLVIMELPEWLLEDLGLEPRVAWKEPDHDVVRYYVYLELLGRECSASARLGTRPDVVLDRLAMMMMGLVFDEALQDLKVLPEPYLRV